MTLALFKNAPYKRLEQAGYGLLEFLVSAVPILLIGLTIIELNQWFQAKQALSLALLEAARAGSTQNANPEAIERAFTNALLPLFPPTKTQTSRQRLNAALEKRQSIAKNTPWQIQILKPNQAIFDDFSKPARTSINGLNLQSIENAYQAEQDADYRQQGRPHGLGPRSGVSIYEANTLVLRLSYYHAPTLPGISGLLKMLAPTPSNHRQLGFAAGYLPIEQELQIDMQSNAINWPSLANLRVVNAQYNDVVMGQPPSSCSGLWCLDAQHTQAPTTASPPINSKFDFWRPEANPSSGHDEGNNFVPKPWQPPQTDENLCGINLCCI